MTYHIYGTAKEEDCSYWTLLKLRENKRIIPKVDVDRHVHNMAYLPFLREVHRQCPDVIPRLFNLHDARLLIDTIKKADEEEEEKEMEEAVVVLAPSGVTESKEEKEWKW